MNLNIWSGTVGYNNKILVSDEKFSLGKNEKVNAPPRSGAQGPPSIGTQPPGGAQAPGPAMKSHKFSKINSLGLERASNISHNRETSRISQQGKKCSGTFSGKWFCNI